MNSSIVRTFFFVVATLVLSLVAVVSRNAVAAPGHDATCSNATMAGGWGFTATGSVISPTGPLPVANVGRVSIDAGGSVSGTQTSSQNGKVSDTTIKGTIAVDSDCTGTITASVSDPAGHVLRTIVLDLVVVNNSAEFRAIARSAAMPDGVQAPPSVVTMSGSKLSH